MVLLGIVGEEVKQTIRALADLTPVEMLRVILDAFARTDLAEHFEVELGSLLDSVGFQILAFRGEPIDAFIQLELDVFHGLQKTLFAGHVELSRVNPCLFDFVEGFP